MTIMQLFESVRIEGRVSIYCGTHVSPTFYCRSKYPLDDIGIIYWEKEIVKVVVGNDNKLNIIVKD